MHWCDMSDEKKSKIRCVCTMQEMGEDRWVKPYDGYLDPDPNCKDCAGSGFKKVKIVFGEGAKAFIGVCAICGETNGVYFQYSGQPPPPDDEKRRSLCLNEDCLGEYCSWVPEDEL